MKTKSIPERELFHILAEKDGSAATFEKTSPSGICVTYRYQVIDGELRCETKVRGVSIHVPKNDWLMRFKEMCDLVDQF